MIASCNCAPVLQFVVMAEVAKLWLAFLASSLSLILVSSRTGVPMFLSLKEISRSSAILEFPHQSRIPPVQLKRNAAMKLGGTRGHGCIFYVGSDNVVSRGDFAAVIKCGSRVHGFLKLSAQQYEILHTKNNSHTLVPLNMTFGGPGQRRMRRDTDEGSWDEGYVLGGLRRRRKKRKRAKFASATSSTSEIVCRGLYCEYFRVRRPRTLWLEMLVVADSSVVSFHGDDVERFVLTLLNLVSAIYSDPTLGGMMNFVIGDLLFLDPGDQDPIVGGDSKSSLAGVNRWVARRWRQDHRRHDVALWLTRRNIGGPSGFAPVAGACDPDRSCSLIREEGLTSAFIVAHELGHILGLSHDGDKGAGNDCLVEAEEGSVMAPMVGATFSSFHWSPCSAREFHLKSWQCLDNYPDMPNATFVDNQIDVAAYSLDQQCRMEFGQGFSFCTSFQLNDPCTHLWCSHEDSSDVCKTKKGPPMDGTECGEGRWCINGQCAATGRISSDGLRHNELDGGWSEWGVWGDCSRSCGVGASFRTRRCDNPRPAYGGRECQGIREEFRPCNVHPCSKRADFREEQCRNLFEIISLDNDEVFLAGFRGQHEWLPYEPDSVSEKCKLACYSREVGEFYRTGENVVDGTPCSYEHASNFCVQGECVKMGCDKILDSPVDEDVCGVCGGDGSKCKMKRRALTGKIRAEEGFKKLAIVPKGAMEIRLVFNDNGQDVVYVLKERATKDVVFTSNGSRQSFVTEGTKFSIFPSNRSLRARGPLLGQLHLLGAVTNESASDFDLQLSYSLSRQFDPLFSIQNNEWVAHGWSKCSKECGGGTQQVLLKCVHKMTRHRLPRRHCQHGSSSHPSIARVRTCNKYPCAFVWVAARWEDCTHTCGKEGSQLRQVFCVPRHKIAEDDGGEGIKVAWRHMVHPHHCGGQDKPRRKRPCNRVPCPGVWTPTNWTQCTSSSSSCIGEQRLLYSCTAPEDDEIRFYRCKPQAIQKRRCLVSGQRCQDGSLTCQDGSQLCSEQVLKRYCLHNDFATLCCLSCSDMKSL